MAKQEKRENEDYLVIAETRALRYIIQYPEERNLFRPSMFIHKSARVLYEAIGELHAQGASIDAASIAQIANTKSSTLTLNVVKGLLWGGEEDFTFSQADGPLLRKELERSEIRAQMQSEVQKALEYISEPSVPDEDFFGNVGKYLVNAQTIALSRSGSPLHTLEEAYNKYEQELDERESGVLGISGDILLDKALVRKTAGGQIITIAAATGSGKSLYLLNLMNGFIELGIPAIYITLEMDMMSTLDRLTALRTKTPISDWYEADKLVNLRRKLKEERKYIDQQSSVEIVEDPSLSLADVNAIIGEFRSKHQIPKEQRIIVGIDLVTQLKDFASGIKGYSMANNYEVAVNLQNAIAKSQNVCFLDIVQFNREADTVDLQEFADLRRTRPTLNNIKNSAAIAERSRVVLSAWRPYYYAQRYLQHLEEVQSMDDIMYVTVLKQSQGEVGQELPYKFNGAYGEVLPTYDASLSHNLLNAEEVGMEELTEEQRLLREVDF